MVFISPDHKAMFRGGWVISQKCLKLLSDFLPRSKKKARKEEGILDFVMWLLPKRAVEDFNTHGKCR